MAKKKEDLGGVWRTVGGRRIFIKDGQDLYEAMNDSGKFTNLKKENFKRKKNDLNKGDVFVNKNGVSKEAKQDQLLVKASRIEEIEEELSKVQSRVWNAENDMADEGIEESRWRENPSYNEDYYKMQDLRKELDKAKDDYWAEKAKINSKRWEKELNSKPKVDKHDLDKLNEIADNYEDVNKYELDEISRDYIKNRRNEMSYNKRNEEFKVNHKPNTTQGKIETIIDKYNNPDRKTATLSDMVELSIQKDGDRYVIVDATETLGYYGGDKYERRSRERIEKELTSDLRKAFNDDNLYLEPEIAGRLVIASDKKELGGFETSTRNSIYTGTRETTPDGSYYEKNFVDEVKNYKQKDQKAYHSAKEVLLSRFNHSYNDGDTKKPDYEKRMSKIRVLEESEDYVLYASKDEEGFVNIQTVTSWNPDSRFDRPPEIYYEQDYKGNIKADSVTVNWGAYGSQDPKTTKEFIDKLTKAQEFADRINKGKDYSKMWDNSNKEKGIYTDKNGSKIGHSMVVQYATMNHLTIEEAKKILGVK